MTYAIRFEHVTKRYPRGWSEDEGPRYASLRHDVASIGKRLTGRRAVSKSHGTLALEDVSFEVEEGESFALIGPNGAGKSTALKMISRISYPTSGKVRIRGRVAALMEVGSGVHPELTGRENIWLYGQILGLRRADIRRRFDEIVAFSELERAVDTPVKFFSTGMQLRLGFSIAAHLEPDVFVVDEALAVGDAGFQAKCVDRMTALVREGKTLLFVSHDLSAVETVCRRGAFLRGGALQSDGLVQDVIRDYIDWVDMGALRDESRARSISGGGLTIERVTVHSLDGDERYAFATGECLEVRFHVEAKARVGTPYFSVGFTTGGPGTILLCSMLDSGDSFDIPPGRYVVACRTGPLPFGPRPFELWASVRGSTGLGDIIDWARVADVRFFHAGESAGPGAVSTSRLYSPVVVTNQWRLDGDANTLKPARIERG